MAGIDWLILGLYFAFVLGIGVALKGSMKTSTDFFLAGRAIPAWVCGLAFMSQRSAAIFSDRRGIPTVELFGIEECWWLVGPS